MEFKNIYTASFIGLTVYKHRELNLGSIIPGTAGPVPGINKCSINIF